MCIRDSHDAIEFLCNEGLSVNEADAMGRTPLHYAAAGNHLLAVRALLRRGAKVNAQTKGGDTPLIKAIEKGNMTIVNELLEHLANPHIVNKQGKTAEKIGGFFGNKIPDYAKAREVTRKEMRSLLVYLNMAKVCPFNEIEQATICLLYTSPSPRDLSTSRMPSSA
eukprot:TRINITY_DN3889_c0_g1_i3.p2 TRINITY_DN3889_c0_g1~~TRINITY_DN3889_c0_g1_i3.p2  ORF type:complete len:166 (-),score=72.63 TRINITY_DN3889_c0_g1_i3:11-508(-)